MMTQYAKETMQQNEQRERVGQDFKKEMCGSAIIVGPAYAWRVLLLSEFCEVGILESRAH